MKGAGLTEGAFGVEVVRGYADEGSSGRPWIWRIRVRGSVIRDAAPSQACASPFEAFSAGYAALVRHLRGAVTQAQHELDLVYVGQVDDADLARFFAQSEGFRRAAATGSPADNGATP